MVDCNQKILLSVQNKAKNNLCADCGEKDPIWASYNLGIFICVRCASVHREIGVHISKVKHLKLDRWEESQVERMKEVGNAASKAKYESRVPPCYRRPDQHSPHILLEQWIKAKYVREEFCNTKMERQHYNRGKMEGFLMKRGKDDSRFSPRKFVLNEADNTLRYHVNENRDPKGVIKLSELNVALAPEKIGNSNSMQLSFMKQGSTRHIYVYHDDSEVLINWYMAIRCAKLHVLQIAYPMASDAELVEGLTRDFLIEGWLWKTGSKPSDGYKKRWFSLDNRKLMYHDIPLDAYPKGEIFIGHESDGFAVSATFSNGCRDARFTFVLKTPERAYALAASTASEQSLWIETLRRTIERLPTNRDIYMAAHLVRKRSSSSSISIFR